MLTFAIYVEARVLEASQHYLYDVEVAQTETDFLHNLHLLLLANQCLLVRTQNETSKFIIKFSTLWHFEDDVDECTMKSVEVGKIFAFGNGIDADDKINFSACT